MPSPAAAKSRTSRLVTRALRLRDAASDQHLDSRHLSAPPITALRTLEVAADMVERGDDAQVAQWIQQLIAPGASLGGARPKASFRDNDGTLWLAKFPSREDRRDVGHWEYLTFQLSLVAGIQMPPARLLKLSSRGHTFAVQRFDQTRTSRRLYTSAMTRLARNESEGASYLDIVEAIERGGSSTRIDAQLGQLFRRVLFNILIGEIRERREIREIKRINRQRAGRPGIHLPRSISRLSRPSRTI